MRHVDGQAGIVELTVVVQNPAPKSVGLGRGNLFEGLISVEVSGPAEALTSGEHVVDLHANAVVRGLPPSVVRNDKREGVHYVRSIPLQEAPLLQRLEHERNISLLEITDPAVHELRRAAGGGLREVVHFEQERIVAPRSGLDGAPEPGGAAADDDEVPGTVPILKSLNTACALHRRKSGQQESSDESLVTRAVGRRKEEGFGSSLVSATRGQRCANERQAGAPVEGSPGRYRPVFSGSLATMSDGGPTALRLEVERQFRGHARPVVANLAVGIFAFDLADPFHLEESRLVDLVSEADLDSAHRGVVVRSILRGVPDVGEATGSVE